MHQIANKLTPQEKQEFATQERIVKAGRDTFIAVGNALATIRDEKLYREQHGTFEEYCDKRWQMSGRHAERMMNASSSVAVLQSAGATELPASESAARPLAALPDEQKAEAWEAATEAAGDEPPTAKQVAAAVEQVKAATPPKPKAEPAAPKPKQSDRYDAALERIGNVCGANIPKLIRSGTLGHIKEKSAIFWASLKDEAMVSLRALVVETSRWTPEHAHRFLAKVPDEKTRILELQSLTIAGGGVTMVTTGYFSTICINTKKRADEYKKVRQILGL